MSNPPAMSGKDRRVALAAAIVVLVCLVAIAWLDNSPTWIHTGKVQMAHNPESVALPPRAREAVVSWVNYLAQGNVSKAETLSTGGELAVLQENAENKIAGAKLQGLQIAPVAASKDAAIAEVSAQTVAAGAYDEADYRLYLLRTKAEWRVYAVQPVPFGGGVGRSPYQAPSETVAAYLAAATQNPTEASQYLAGEALQASSRDTQLAGQVAGALKILGLRLQGDGVDGDVAWVRGTWQAQIGKEVRPVTAEFILKAIAGVWRIERIDPL